MKKKIVVPPEMLKAVVSAMLKNPVEYTGLRNFEKDVAKSIAFGLEAALLWIGENPIVPTEEQAQEMARFGPLRDVNFLCAEWQRRMFLAPEPEVPESVEETIEIDYYESDNMPSGSVAVLKDGRRLVTEEAWRMIEAYRRVKESR